MGLLDRPATKDELLSHETQSEAPAEGGMGLIAGLRDDSNRLAAVRGVMWGAISRGNFDGAHPLKGLFFSRNSRRTDRGRYNRSSV